MERKAVFIDKDGTLIPDIPYNVNADLITLNNGAANCITRLRRKDFIPVVISNQSGVAHGYFDEKDLVAVSDKIGNLLEREGAAITHFYYCPHHPNGRMPAYAIACACRKPSPGLILRAARELSINRALSWMIGDILHDIEAGKRAGCRTILIDNGNETDWILNDVRRPDFIARDLEDAANIILTHSS
jgi:D-glycero-D-manno-heptose 1,7-bisphosphate phosphatase